MGFSKFVYPYRIGFNPLGYKTFTKVSMKVKINWEDREERFLD